jgi:hypothetical protein
MEQHPQHPAQGDEAMNGQGGVAEEKDGGGDGGAQHTTVTWDIAPPPPMGANNGLKDTTLATGIKQYTDSPFEGTGAAPGPEFVVWITVLKRGTPPTYFEHQMNVPELECVVQKTLGALAPEMDIYAMNAPNGLNQPVKSDPEADYYPPIVAFATPQTSKDGTRVMIKFSHYHTGTPNLKFNSNHILGEDYNAMWTRAEYVGSEEPTTETYLVKCKSKPYGQYTPPYSGMPKKSFPLGYFQMDQKPSNSAERNAALTTVYEALMQEIGEANVGLSFNTIKGTGSDTIIWLTTYEQTHEITSDLETMLRMTLQIIDGITAFDTQAEYNEAGVKSETMPVDQLLEIKSAQDNGLARRYFSPSGDIQALVTATETHLGTTGNVLTKCVFNVDKGNFIVYNGDASFGKTAYRAVLRFIMTYMTQNAGIKSAKALDDADEDRLAAAVRTQKRNRSAKAPVIDMGKRKDGMAKKLKMDAELSKELDQRVEDAKEAIMEDMVTDRIAGNAAAARK